MRRKLEFRQWFHGTYEYFGFGEDISGGTTFTCAPSCNMKKFPVEQYTGLKDKNGKKIFEGDIVVSEVIYKSQVKYSDNDACFAFEDLPIVEYMSSHWDEPIEVIGNIHENPELIEEYNG